MFNVKKNSILAKILSSENIFLSVQEGTGTAFFDLKKRMLSIPEWMFGDEDFYMMVLGHEIAHCVFTPYEGWMNIRKHPKYDPKNDQIKKYIMSATNILEDIRIDQLIQNRYPGLRKHYRASVKFIIETNFFKLKENEDPNIRSFLNRICIYSKSDARNSFEQYGIKFNPEEQEFVDRVYAASKYEEIVDLAYECLERWSVVDELSEFDKNNTSEDDDEENNNQPSESAAKKTDERLEIDEESLSASEAWDESIEQVQANIAISKTFLNKDDYFELFEPKKIEATKIVPKRETTKVVDRLMDDFKNYVDTFSMKFNMKKRARELIHTQEHVLGRIDPLRLHKYKYDDNIFERRTIENHQKNHGFIFLIDCSGSMASVFESLMTQVYAFYRICDRIDVPYSFYGYTDTHSSFFNTRREERTNFGNNLVLYDIIQKGGSKKEQKLIMEELFSSRSIEMGGTPTSDALLGIIPKIKEFNQRYMLDILNLVVITDGGCTSGMPSKSLKLNNAYYFNTFSPRGVVDNTAAIYSLLRDQYNVRVSHVDITKSVPEMVPVKEKRIFSKEGTVLLNEFGGANNVIWIDPKLIKDASTKVIDNLITMLA